MFFSIFCPHLYSARAMFRIKRVSISIYGTTYDTYIIIIIIIYENCTVRLASVGLAQARPNYIIGIYAHAKSCNSTTDPDYTVSYHCSSALPLFLPSSHAIIVIKWTWPGSCFDSVVHLVPGALVVKLPNGKVVVWWPKKGKGPGKVGREACRCVWYR